MFLLAELDFASSFFIVVPFVPPIEFFLGSCSYLAGGFFGGCCGFSSIIPYYFWASCLFWAMSSASSSLLIIILIAFLLLRGNIISLAFCSSLEVPPSVGFRSYLTLSAYLSVLSVFSEEAEEGETLPIIKVRQKPTKESLRTIVSLEPLNGVCPLPWSRALMHSLRDNRDLLIYAPSILVCLFMSI